MRVLVVGAGGHAVVVVDVVRLAMTDCEVVGLLDDAVALGTAVAGTTVLGPIARAGQIPHDVMAMAIGDNGARATIFETLRTAKESFPPMIHPTATVAASARIGYGTIVLAHAVVNADAVIGDDVIINTAATVDHHSRVDSHTHIAPGVHVAGGCHIGEAAAIGIGAVVAPSVSVGSRTFVGAGSVVLDDLPESVIAYGAPARVIRRRTPSDSFR